MRWRWLLVGLLGCDGAPPHRATDAVGHLDDDLACSIYPGSGFSLVNLGNAAILEVGLPIAPDVWGRGIAYYGEVDADGCRYDADGIVVRVQYGAALDRGYRPLFVDGLDFGAVRACARGDGCDDTQCRDVAATAAARLAMWCEDP